MNLLLVFGIIPLILSLGFLSIFQTDWIGTANAMKSQGNFLTETGSNKVCGDKLCSEILDLNSSEKDSILSDMLLVDIVPVSDKISILVGSNGFTGGNIGVLTGDDGMLLIDDGLPSALDGILLRLEQLKTCSGCDGVKFIVNTHWHGDHVGGNHHFGQQGTVIVGHENLRDMLSSPQFLEFYNVNYDAYPNQALPVITFDSSIFLYFNNEKIHVIHLPNGHTNNDSIVYFEDSNILHLGDHFFNGIFPFVDLKHGGSVQGLIKNIAYVLDTFPEDSIVIPGHGNLANMNDLRIYHDMLIETSKIVQEGIVNDKTLLEIQEKGLPDKWQSWDGGNIKSSTWIEFIYNDFTN